MKTMEFQPFGFLGNPTVNLIQQTKGQFKRFIECMMQNRYHCFTFEISQEDAKVLFKVMKRMIMANKACGHYGVHKSGYWFIQVQKFSDPVLEKKGGKYYLTVCSYRKA